MRALLLAAVLSSGCSYAVSATGLMSWTGDELRITGANGKYRPIAPTQGAEPLRWTDGMIVDVDGVLRKGAIEVDTWRIIEGPFGFTPWVGEVGQRDGELMLYDSLNRLSLTLTGDATAGLEAHVGKLVLVEGITIGPNRARVMGWRALHAPEVAAP